MRVAQASHVTVMWACHKSLVVKLLLFPGLSFASSGLLADPQAIIWTPPIPVTARYSFGARQIDACLAVQHRHCDRSPVLHCHSSDTCHPCYPGRFNETFPLSDIDGGGLPLLPTGSASPAKWRGYVLVHLRYGLYLCPWETYNPRLPGRCFMVLKRCTDNSFFGT